MRPGRSEESLMERGTDSEQVMVCLWGDAGGKVD